MKFRSNPLARCSLTILCLLVAWNGAAAHAKDFRFQALLIWATDASHSPDPRHKPVDEEVRKKLKGLPLRWSNFFEVKRIIFTVSNGGSQEEILSTKCRIVVKDVDESTFEVSLFGEGQQVLNRIQRLPKGEMLVLGGNAPDETGWLVAVKRIE